MEIPLVRRVWKNTQSGDPRFLDIDSKILRAIRMRARVQDGRGWYVVKWNGLADLDSVNLEYLDGTPVTIELRDRFDSVDPDGGPGSNWYAIFNEGREVGRYLRYERNAGERQDGQLVMVVLFPRK